MRHAIMRRTVKLSYSINFIKSCQNNVKLKRKLSNQSDPKVPTGNDVSKPNTKHSSSNEASNRTKMVRLSKRMSELNLCSRREADHLISLGNGSILLKGMPVSPILGQKVNHDELDIVIRDPSSSNIKTRSLYHEMNDLTKNTIDDSWWNRVRGDTVILNKPMGYVSSQPNSNLKQIPALALLTKKNFYMHSNTTTNTLIEGSSSVKQSQLNHMKLTDLDLLETFQNHLVFENRKRSNKSVKVSPRLFGYAPAGRLDKESTGLLVYTRSGLLAKKLIGHQTTITKEYIVHMNNIPNQSIGKHLTLRKSRGIYNRNFFSKLPSKIFNAESIQPPDLSILFQDDNYLSGDNRPLLPVVDAEWINCQSDYMTQNNNSIDTTLCMRLVLMEGRKRQIRRMCAELFNREVISLERIRVGPINLEKLPIGRWRPLLKWEFQSILDA